jgi:hypothetical protein
MLLPALCTCRALSQTTDLYEQAMGGIRYFDLRICWNGTDFDTYHFETGNTIPTLLNDVQRFIAAHPTEIVVIEGQVWEPANHTIPLHEKLDLVKFILSTFEGALYPESKSFNFTYRELLNSNYRVLFTIDDEDMYDAGRSLSGQQLLWWGSDTIWNTYANTHNFTTMQAFNTVQITIFNSNSSSGGSPLACDRYALNSACLYKVSWTLTTDGTAIIESLFPGHPHSLIEMADTANNQLATFVNQSWIVEPQWRLGNIFIIDDFANSPLMTIIMQQNIDAAADKQSQKPTSRTKSRIILTEV